MVLVERLCKVGTDCGLFVLRGRLDFWYSVVALGKGC